MSKSFEFLNTNAYYTRDDAEASIPITRPYSIIILHQKPINDKGISPRLFLVYDNHNDFDNLVNIKDNNYLNEYYPENKASYFYIDVDKEGVFTVHEKLIILNQILSTTLKQSIKHFQRTFKYIDCSVWDASRPNKLSLHISVPLAFKNKTDLNKFGKLLYTFHPEYIDPNLYNRTAQLRLPYQCKRGYEEYPLLPYKCPVNLQKFKEDVFNIISYPEDIKDYCDVSSIEAKINKKLKIQSNTKLSANPDFETDDEIKFYLSCIPNHNEGQSLSIWRMIGMILHRYKQSVHIWIDWSNQCSLYGDQTETCIKFYNSFKTQEENKGYKIGTLIKLARQYVPKNEIWFNQLYSKLSTLNKQGFDYHSYNNKFVKPYPIQYDVILERSPMGTGKTYSIKQYIKEHNPQKILYLSPRIIFAHNIKGEFSEHNFQCYKDEAFKTTDDRIICSIESIHRLNNKIFDLVVMDESETILNTFNSPTLKQIKNSVDSFQRIIQNSKKLIIMDAFLSSRSTDFINNIVPPNRKKLLRINEFKPVARTAYELPSGKALIRKLREKLCKGFKCVVATGSNTFCHSIIEELSDILNEKKYKFYEANTDDTDKKDVLDARKAWGNIDLLIYTPTISVGVNFDIPDIYDYLFIYGSDNTTTVRDMMQSSMRIRHLKQNKMFYCYHLSHNHDGFLTVKKIEETLDDRKKNLNELSKEWSDVNINENYKWLRDLMISSILERNVSAHFYDKLFKKYINALNYEIKIVGKVKPDDKCKGSKGGYIDLSKYTFSDIVKSEIAVKANKATTEQKLIYSNRYMEALINTDLLTKQQKEEFYNSVMTNQATLDKFERLSRTLNGKLPNKIVDNISEVLNDYSTLYPYINKLTNLLGLKSLIDTTTIINNETLSKNKDELNKVIDIIHKDMQIYDIHKKRDKKAKEQSDEVKMINRINQALYRWCDIGIEKNTEKRKMIKGKTQRIRDYKIAIHIPLPIIDKPLEDLLIKKVKILEVKPKYIIGTPEYIERQKLQSLRFINNKRYNRILEEYIDKFGSMMKRYDRVLEELLEKFK